jgi:hypothetical protein
MQSTQDSQAHILPHESGMTCFISYTWFSITNENITFSK